MDSRRFGTPERRNSDPVILLCPDSPSLHFRRNGKPDIFTGVCGDKLLSLYMNYHHHTEPEETMLRATSCHIPQQQTELRKGESSNKNCRSSGELLSVRTPPQSLSSEDICVVKRPDTGSKSPRLKQRRNGLCYVNSTDMILKTMKQKKATETFKRRSNLLLQLSY